jgi:tetratricopeptide (TPR) repeat protein
MSVTAFADEPYESYSYDNWESAIPSQSGYTVQKTVTGTDMGLERLSDPTDPLYYADDASSSLSEGKDMYVFDDSEIWVADTGNNRILRLNSDYEVTGRYYTVTGESVLGDDISKTDDGSATYLSSPQGIFVMTSPTTGKQTVYIADYDNSRVVRASVDSDTELTLEQEYVKPEEALYTSKTFNPTKVLVDYAENVYAVVKSVNTGSVQFKSDGSFTGFYGANRVEVTAKVIAQKLWRKIASNEQIEGMSRNVPVEYANFDIDDEGFIYTVTEVSTDTDAVKKINPAGYNIWDNSVGDEYNFGDYTDAVWDIASNKKHVTKLTDIAVDSDGIMNVLDYETGRVFQYDRLANLICIFGTTTSSADQRGSFSAPNAVDTINDTVIVLDGSKTRNDITVFEKTKFGENLHQAFAYFDAGLYTEAAPYWQEVLKRDGGYTYAYIGLGKADLKNNDYAAALDKFEVANDKDDYDKAFEYYREEWLQNHFYAIFTIIIVLIVLLIVKKILNKKGIKLIKRRKKKEAE